MNKVAAGSFIDNLLLFCVTIYLTTIKGPVADI
jgi:hypothetical protein